MSGFTTVFLFSDNASNIFSEDLLRSLIGIGILIFGLFRRKREILAKSKPYNIVPRFLILWAVFWLFFTLPFSFGDVLKYRALLDAYTNEWC